MSKRKTWDGWLRRNDAATAPAETATAVAEPPAEDAVSRTIPEAPAARLVDLDDTELQRAIDEAREAAGQIVERSTATQDEIATLTRRLDDVEAEAQRRVQLDEQRDALRGRLSRNENAGPSVGFTGSRDRINFDSTDPDDAALSREERLARALKPVGYVEGRSWFHDFVQRNVDPFAAQALAQYGQARLRAVSRAGLGMGAAMPDQLQRAVTGTGEGSVTGNVAATAAGLVPPQYLQDQIATLRRETAVIAPLVTTLNVTSNTFYVPQVTAGVSVAFRAELAVKARSNMTAGTLAASVYSASGVTIISDELAEDSNPDAQMLIAQDYAIQHALAIDSTILAGTGSSQPLGVLNVSGRNTSAWAAGSGTVGQAIYASLISARTALNTGGYYGSATAIVMRPEHAAFLLAGLGNTAASMPLLANANGSLSFLGTPIVTTTLLPVDATPTPDTASILVADWRQVVLGMRRGITFATSEHFAFDQDAITLRSDVRYGVQPARYPKAIVEITGVPVA